MVCITLLIVILDANFKFWYFICPFASLNNENSLQNINFIVIRTNGRCDIDSSIFYQQSVTTNEIDETVHQMIIEAEAYPSPLGYGQFPKSVCTSVNECMYHGIPDTRQLQVFSCTLSFGHLFILEVVFI